MVDFMRIIDEKNGLVKIIDCIIHVYRYLSAIK